MKNVTTAMIIDLTQKLEDDSMTFYETLAQRWPEHQDTFAKFAKEDKRNKTQIVRTYQETISDALEASYSFEGMDLDAYTFDTTLAEDTSLAKALKKGLALEETVCRFYEEVAERSESLLATIPRAFKRVAKKRKRRISKLESLL